MKLFYNKYRIEPNRCEYWDYSSPGRYFITICTNRKHCFLGKVVNRKMELSRYGKIVKNEMLKIPQYHKRALLDEWVIMPNHIHFIIILGANDFDNGVATVGGGDGHGNGVDDGQPTPEPNDQQTPGKYVAPNTETVVAQTGISAHQR